LTYDQFRKNEEANQRLADELGINYVDAPIIEGMKYIPPAGIMQSPLTWTNYLNTLKAPFKSVGKFAKDTFGGKGSIRSLKDLFNVQSAETTLAERAAATAKNARKATEQAIKPGIRQFRPEQYRAATTPKPTPKPASTQANRQTIDKIVVILYWFELAFR